MPTAYFYFPEDKLDLYVWFKSLPKDKRSKVAVSALEAAFKSEGKAAKPKDIKKALQDKQKEDMENMKAAVMRMFEDVPTEPAKQKAWARENSFCVSGRLDMVTKKLPDTVKKEARFYFLEQFPILAKEAGLE